jgi:transposase
MATEEVAMAYAPGAVERAMKVQEVIVQAIAGKLTWIQAAEILGCSARTIRRYRWRLERDGYDGLFDRRRRLPSPKRAPLAELQRVLALYRDRYRDFNVRHFHQVARREHGVRFCYAFVKKALQSAGLVPTHRPRGRHRRRREPRACFGELLHLDGSRHRWLALRPEQWFTLIVVVDDATKRILHAELWDGGESVAAVMSALHAVVEHYGVPMALYTDRAHWAAHTPTAGGPPDRRRLTQVGRALARLGIEHILAYSPAARGRSERVNRTLQDRLVNEWRVAGITTLAAANHYLREPVPARVQCRVRSRTGRSRLCLCPGPRRGPRAHSLRRRRARRWPRQCRHDRERRAAAGQAARPADLCRASRPRATSPQRSALRLVRCTLSRALRPARPAHGCLSAVNPRSGQITVSNSERSDHESSTFRAIQ